MLVSRFVLGFLFFEEVATLLNEIRSGSKGKAKPKAKAAPTGRNEDFHPKTFAMASAVSDPRKTTRHLKVTLNEADSFDEVLQKLKDAYNVTNATYFRLNVMTNPDIRTFDRKPLHLYLSDNGKQNDQVKSWLLAASN